MRTAGTGCWMAIGFAALVGATSAVASSDSRTRCARPIVPDMTVYRPGCPTGDDQAGALFLAPDCSRGWPVLDTPCSPLERAGVAAGRNLLGPYDLP